MITVKSNARKGVVVSSKLLLDSTTAAEFKDFPQTVEKMANDGNFDHMIEVSCNHETSSVLSQTFNRVVTMDELEEFEKRHMAWLVDVKGSIETEEMAAQQERERECECPCHETACDDDNAIQEKDIEFIKHVEEIMDEVGLPFTADVKVQPFGIPAVRIGDRLLRILIKDAVEKYVR